MLLTLDCYVCIFVCSHHVFVVCTVFDTVKEYKIKLKLKKTDLKHF